MSGKQLVRRILAGMGLGSAPRVEPLSGAPDAGTRLAQERTRLALERNYLADERTLMAWIRTAMSMISFGFSMAKIFQSFKGSKGEWEGLFGRTYSAESIGYYLVILGTAGLISAVVQHILRLRTLRALGFPRQLSVALVVAILLCLLGVFAFGSLVLKL
jgi:putative membrane protein